MQAHGRSGARYALRPPPAEPADAAGPLAALLETSSLGVCLVAPRTRVIEQINAAACSLYDLHPAEAVGRPVTDVLVPTLDDAEWRLTRADGTSWAVFVTSGTVSATLHGDTGLLVLLIAALPEAAPRAGTAQSPRDRATPATLLIELTAVTARLRALEACGWHTHAAHGAVDRALCGLAQLALGLA